MLAMIRLLSVMTRARWLLRCESSLGGMRAPGPLRGIGQTQGLACATQPTWCAWRSNWTVMVPWAADFALSGQQSRQFSATSARAECQSVPQA